MEDIVNTDQRPKLEDFDKYFYIVLKLLDYDETNARIDVEQVSIILGETFVVSIQERQGGIFDQIVDRIRSGKGPARKMGRDYLAYRLIDAVVDRYFTVLEKISDAMVGLEDELISSPSQKTVQVINKLKHETMLIRKAVGPLREVINAMQKSEVSLVKDSTKVYLRDLKDNIIQVTEDVATFHEILSGMLDMYHSSLSNRTNEIVKVLTIMSSIFIPLTFLTSLYGMNFQRMPGVESPYGFFVILAAMLLASTGLIFYFKKKKWI